MRVLITGASGFVGSKACTYLKDNGHEVFAHSRTYCNFPQEIKLIRGGSLSNIFSKPELLEGFECVIHLAGRTYETNRSKKNCYSKYFKDNVEETLRFAELCSSASIKRFIFMSSIKVNGESTKNRIPFHEEDIPSPQDYYALSKYEAELGLLKIVKDSKMEVVIVRPPLIYGDGVKGYFKTILKLIKLRIPLPFGSFVDNRRSLIYLDNLLNFLEILIQHPKAGNQIFVCSDDTEISTADLLRELSYGMHKKNYNYNVPKFLLLLSYLIGKGQIYKKLNESLVINNYKSKKLLGWEPPVRTLDALKKVSNQFINYHKKF
ncbi:NAD-dependent epimerase/dehydratase family protein [Prochlorococcus marinus]|uniref:NAD-dependent epimerase/dehydratase family protein n=1 Tax=Prochlorococcus marinus TaxID=1219 RepID=UPI001ADC5F8C|nr:NAD-dependent epimerase/dehydratase family protein [Prochlorococcus marinus]MBO8217674.1 NAD-dependent epimerase/dehydratase family protein [Prochlorococcus marinus XMU1405]MBW3040836.1 hypothetical protein [Prochlorococcus marinus str. MU1405]MBW3048295.1 hypothetical protein [Prochlorococcus marinus str. MU1406]